MGVHHSNSLAYHLHAASEDRLPFANMSVPIKTSLASRQRAKDSSITSDQWTAHIGQIRRLYIEEGHVLVDVMKIMEREHNFYATYENIEPHVGRPLSMFHFHRLTY